MAAPAPVGAGPGVVITTGTATVNRPLNAVVGDLVILQVLQDGTGTNNPTLGTFVGIENLAGTNDAMSSLVLDALVGTTFHQHLWVGRVYTAGTVSVDVTAVDADDLYCRLYEFSDVAAGSSLTDIAENSGGTADLFRNGAGIVAGVNDTLVTTTGADRLALNFYAINDDNALADFAGESGGDWVVDAAFASATGTDGAIGLQIATLASAGSIDGGSATMAAADGWGVIGLALKPVVSAAAPGPNYAGMNKGLRNLLRR